MVFCFVQNFFFGQQVRIIFFCRAKRKFFFQNLTLSYMTKTLNQIILFFLHQNQNIFFSNIGNQYFFRKKPYPPPSPFKLNGRSLSFFQKHQKFRYQIIQRVRIHWVRTKEPFESLVDQKTICLRYKVFLPCINPRKNLYIWPFIPC